MKVLEIIKKINDNKCYIEIKENANNGGGTHGFYTRSELIYNTNLNKRTIDSLNVQYIKGKRLLIINVK